MSPQAEKVLRLLRRTPAGVTVYVLARSRVGNVRSAIGELRAAGYEIAADRSPGRFGLRYRLVAEPQLALVTDEGEVFA